MSIVQKDSGYIFYWVENQETIRQIQGSALH